MQKTQLRSQFLTQRKQLSPDTIEAFSFAIRDSFFKTFSLLDISSLHIYLPILKQNEVNTWLIIQQIWEDYPHLTLVTSKTNLSDGTMQSYRLEKNTTLLENRWGVPEPVNAQPFADDQIDMILLPLLAFDQQGHRVGYGKGCYDRFLQKCKPRIIKVGLSFFEPVEKIEEVHETDLKMNFCVTPGKVFTMNHG